MTHSASVSRRQSEPAKGGVMIIASSRAGRSSEGLARPTPALQVSVISEQGGRGTERPDAMSCEVSLVPHHDYDLYASRDLREGVRKPKEGCHE
jgi:hypothetical protein